MITRIYLYDKMLILLIKYIHYVLCPLECKVELDKDIVLTWR